MVMTDGDSRTVAPAAPSGRLTVAAAAIVALGSDGPFIPPTWEREILPVDLAGLRLLRTLAGAPDDEANDVVERIAAHSGADPGPLHDLLAALLERQMVRPHDGSSTRAETPRPVTPGSPIDAPLDRLALPTPVFFRVTAAGFEWFDHDGELRLRVDPRQLMALTSLTAVRTLDEADADQQRRLGDDCLAPATFRVLVREALEAGVVARFDPDDPGQNNAAREAALMRERIGQSLQVTKAFNDLADQFEIDETERTERTGTTRTPVIPIHHQWSLPPLSLGLLVAYAKAYDDGALEEHYAFHPSMFTDPARLAGLAARPSIFCFSNYIWCHTHNSQQSATIKSINPANITIHGGPDTPKYQADVDRYFEEHPHVDITVRGEGETTFAAILAALADHVGGDGPVDLSVLDDVPGLSYRGADGRAVHTADRDRIEDLDILPSPYLAGLFDGFIAAGPSAVAIVETNRGCPYGCTFCDWGSATLSRIRKFDLDRVFAELAWCARNKIDYVVIGDANFGIFERDVEIAQYIADLRSEHGFPTTVGTNYAKNTVKHLSKIIDIFASAGIVAEGKVSLQTMDEGTLTVIKRKNIKVEKYNDLSVEFRKNDLPLSVELMMGLPGATAASFRQDLQECIARDVRTMVYPTILLPNSPMNDPAYREEHGIVAKPGERVRETTSFTRAEWEQMERLTQVFLLCDLFGVLRQVSMFVHHETGIREVEFYERLLDAARFDRERFPIVTTAFEIVPRFMVPPVSWSLFLDEVRSFVVQDLGVADDDALETTMQVQRALLPARERTFPLVLELPHDFAAWHQAVLTARGSGHRHTWTEVVPRLSTFPAAQLTVTDPHKVCSGAMSNVLASLNVQGGWWEFGCSISRPVVSEAATPP